MERKTRSQKLIETVAALVAKFKVLDCPETKAFLKVVKANAKTLDVNQNESFKQMAKDRQAVKFAGVSEDAFKASLQKYIAEQQAIFNRAKTLSKEKIAALKAMQEKAKATRAAKVADLADLLK